MRIGEVIGNVTLNRADPSLSGATLKLAIPLTLDELAGRRRPQGDTIVVYDELGAGVGSRIALTEGAEAAQPFYPDVKPIDAYNAAILDDVQLTTKIHHDDTTKQRKES
jgi:microcompartment protein CcmK/EutM